MRGAIIPTRAPEARSDPAGDPAHFTLWSLGARLNRGGPGQAEVAAAPLVPAQERIRKIPEALLLTAGYYGGRVPLVSRLLRELD
jgi:hypothetical protein